MRRFVLHWAWVFALGAAPLVGCTDVVEAVTLSVTTTEAPSLDADIFGGPAFGGVEVCETDTDNCAETDAVGRATIDVPAKQEVSYTVEKEGYVPYLVGDVTDGSFLDSTWPMVSDELMASGSEILGLPYPWMGGVIELRPLPAMAGVTFDLADETAVGYYRERNKEPVARLDRHDV